MTQQTGCEKLVAKLTPYSSVVGGGLQLQDEDGRMQFVVALMGVSNGISKEQSSELSQRLADGFNSKIIPERVNADHFSAILEEVGMPGDKIGYAAVQLCEYLEGKRPL